MIVKVKASNRRASLDFEAKCKKWFESQGCRVCTPREIAWGSWRHKDFFGLFDGFAVKETSCALYRCKTNWVSLRKQAAGKRLVNAIRKFDVPCNFSKGICYPDKKLDFVYETIENK